MTGTVAGQRADVVLECSSAASAQAVLAALQIELAEGPDGCTAAARVNGTSLEVEVTAPDVASLRAALNSLVRLADAAERVAA